MNRVIKAEIYRYVWLGLNSVVLKGVTIGRNSVIGANSVVARDISANVITAGNPCKVVRELKNN
jgi:maltose O-acetyltransferase